MIRLLLFSLVSLPFFSCEDVYTKDDELFYQLSEADSARCMEEILDGILEESIEEEQKIRDVLYEDIPYCGPKEILYISVNSIGQVMIQDEGGSTDVSEKVYHYFMFNRFLTSDETDKAAMNVNHPGFEFPLYNHVEMYEIDREIGKAKKKWLDVKNTEGVDSTFVNYFYSKVEEWQTRKNALEIIGNSMLPEISASALVQLHSHGESVKFQKVLKEIAIAFYHIRNSECMQYFGETYLSLYERAQRKKKELDFDKLRTLQVLSPGRIYIGNRSVKEPSCIEVPIAKPTP